MKPYCSPSRRYWKREPGNTKGMRKMNMSLPRCKVILPMFICSGRTRRLPLRPSVLAGPKFGPKVSEENKRAMALDDHNPQVCASQGRQYLMAPKMFGGDVSKAIENF